MNLSFKAVALTIARGLGLTDTRLMQAVGVVPTNSGEAVSISTALSLDTVLACVRLIAQTFATLPGQVYKMDASGRGVLARDHPLYSLIHDQPNSDMTAVSFWEALIASYLLHGNGYALIDRVRGRLTALTPLMPERLKPEPQADGSLVYVYSVQGRTERYTEDKIFHLKNFSLDGLQGLSPISMARETLGIALAAEKSAASFFRNAMRPSMVMTAAGFLGPDKRKQFEEETLPKFVGAMNSGRTPFLEGGYKLEHISMSPDDAQLLATRAFSVEQVCRLYGVAPVMIGHNEKSTSWGSGLEQMNLWFLTYTMRPILKMVEQEIRRSLLSPVERLTYYAEFNVDALLRADTQARTQQMKVLAESGLRTRNELRAWDNAPPLPDGDDLTVMSNMLPIQLLGKQPPAVAPKPSDSAFQPSPENKPGTANDNSTAA